jgi:SRSO17 transposase
MTERKAIPTAPGPLEDYAAQYDDLWAKAAQRESFRAYLQGLLLPRDRNKTLTGLAGARPIEDAQHPRVQKLQYFLSESPWDGAAINARRLELLLDDPSTAPHQEGVLIIDDSGDRKSGTKTDHVARQYLGSIGKIDNGIVAVSSLWADPRLYFPLHVLPYTPAGRLAGGRGDPNFQTKPQLGLELVTAARQAGVPFRAIVADNFYGDNFTFQQGLGEAGLPYVLALRPNTGTWAPVDAAHTPKEAAEDLDWGGPEAPGEWQPVLRRFRDGHEETWWAAELRLAGYGPDQRVRLVAATTDPTTLPEGNTWYLITNLPRPGSDRATQSPFQSADLGEVVRLYGLRIWVEQSYKQVKQELGWADFMVRADRAIRRHWILVFCAFCFCWQAWFGGEETRGEGLQRGKNAEGRPGVMAGDPAAGPGLADPLDPALALVAGLVARAPTIGAAGATELGGEWSPLQPLSPVLTKYC